jgi:hypothetical protein
VPHRIAPLAEADLDDIWLYAAKESGSIKTGEPDSCFGRGSRFV